MLKSKTTFFCQNCGARYPKWQGQCQKCGKWNTIEEQILENPSKKIWDTSKSELTKSNSSPVLISEINIQSEKRVITKDSEFNRVMGGGIVPGSVVLLGGEPGIGKSTLFLQLSLYYHQAKKPRIISAHFEKLHFDLSFYLFQFSLLILKTFLFLYQK